MVDVDKAVIARLKKGEHSFEVLVDCDAALKFKNGVGSLDDVLATDEIYKDVKKGEHASDLSRFFGSDDPRKVAETIIMEGEVQLTAEYKNKLRDRKKKEIAVMIARNAVDPKTGSPHPLVRIENAMDEVGVKVDGFKKAEDQVSEVVKKVREILPLAYELREVLFIIPAQYTGKSFSIIKRSASILKEKWEVDGSLHVTVEVPAGLQAGLFDELNNVAHGHIESKVVKTK